MRREAKPGRGGASACRERLTGGDPGGWRAHAAGGLTEDAAFPERMGRPEDYAHRARGIFENPMLDGSVVRLDGGQRFAPK